MFYLQLSEIEGVDQPAAVPNGDGKRAGEEGEETEERLIKKVVELKVNYCYSLFGKEAREGGRERGRERERENFTSCFPPFLQLHLSSSTGPVLRDISLSVNASLPLTIHPSHFTVPEVSSTHKVEPLVVTVVCTPSLLPTSTSLTVSATYNSPNGNAPAVFPMEYVCILSMRAAYS